MIAKKSFSKTSILHKNVNISSLIVVSVISLLGMGLLLYYFTTNSTEMRSKAAGPIMSQQNLNLIKKLTLTKYPPEISDSICPIDAEELYRISQKNNIPRENKPDICSKKFLDRTEDCNFIIAYNPIPNVQSCKKQMPYWKKVCKPREMPPGAIPIIPEECRQH